MAAANPFKNFIQILGHQYAVDEWTNITPRLLEYMERRLLDQKHNPLHLVSERIRHFFRDRCPDEVGASYDEFKFQSPIVTVEDNFDSLLIPKNHVSRKKADTYYANSRHLFRSHTSAHQMHCLAKGSKAFISIADCYRRDEIDRSHFPVFHQCEVFKLYNREEAGGSILDSSGMETDTKQGGYTQEASVFAEAKLKSSVEQFVKVFFDNPSLQTRWVNAYFPFTHPSFELEILWKGKWLEVLGCGVVRKQILDNAGLDTDYVGFAAGFGLERFAMLKYEIPDIRLFWSKDTGFLHQFEDKSPFDEVRFKPFSNCPQCINDISFWLPTGSPEDCPQMDCNDFNDLCRNIAGDMIEQVKQIDHFKHPKTGRVSQCYRIVYRSADKVLTKDEVNVVHEKIGLACKNQYHVELR